MVVSRMGTPPPFHPWPPPGWNGGLFAFSAKFPLTGQACLCDGAPMQIGERLRELRKEQGLAQEALAFRAGVSVSTVARTEGGKLSPTLDTLASLAGALGVTVSELVDEPTGAAS